jgi:hypothetical protein
MKGLHHEGSGIEFVFQKRIVANTSFCSQELAVAINNLSARFGSVQTLASKNKQLAAGAILHAVFACH